MFWSLASAAADGSLDLGGWSIYAQSAVGTSMIAFGGLNWALDGAAAPVAAVLRLEPAMAPRRRAAVGRRARPTACRPARSASATSPSPTRGGARPVLDGFDLTIPAGIVAGHRRPERRRQDHAGQAAVPALRPAAGAIEVDGVDLRELDLDVVARAAHRGVPGLHPLRAAAARQRRARAARPTTTVLRGAARPPAPTHLADLDTVLARGYDGGTDLSGGQWQRVALARALCAVQLGAGVVLLDEPTAQLDVRGEAEIFDRILAATRALHDDPDLAPLLDRAPRRPHLRARARPGVELGTHDELMALGGRYRTMFDLQAQRFDAGRGRGGGGL